MRYFVAAVFFACQLLAGTSAQNASGGVTCFKCTANDTSCRDTCVGMYCYKTELQGQDQQYIKRGCLSRKDELSKVDQCTARSSVLPGGTTVSENFCICRTDRCNGASSSWWSSVAAFFAAVVAYIWKD